MRISGFGEVILICCPNDGQTIIVTKKAPSDSSGGGTVIAMKKRRRLLSRISCHTIVKPAQVRFYSHLGRLLLYDSEIKMTASKSLGAVIFRQISRYRSVYNLESHIAFRGCSW